MIKASFTGTQDSQSHVMTANWASPPEPLFSNYYNAADLMSKIAK